MKRVLFLLMVSFGIYHTAYGQASVTENRVDSVKLISKLSASGKITPLNAGFGERVVVFVSGPSAPFEKSGAAKIYVNNLKMPYDVAFNCPCENLKDTSKKYFTLTFTIGAHDTTWNKWYGFGDTRLAVKLDVGTADKAFTCSTSPNLQIQTYHNGALIFAAIVAVLFVLVTLYFIFFAKLDFLRDQSTATPKPYSLSRFQLLWWTTIIICSYILLFAIRDDFALLSQSTLILLGISAAGTGFSQLIDYSDSDKDRHQEIAGKNFFYDILSDNNGLSIHRYQNFIFTIVFGIVFVYKVFATANMPNFGVLELSLMGLSTATYVGLKTNENNTPKQSDASADNIAG